MPPGPVIVRAFCCPSARWKASSLHFGSALVRDVADDPAGQHRTGRHPGGIDGADLEAEGEVGRVLLCSRPSPMRTPFSWEEGLGKAPLGIPDRYR